MLVAVSSNAVTAEVTHCDQVLDMNVRCLFSLSQCVAYIELVEAPYCASVFVSCGVHIALPVNRIKSLGTL